MLQTNSLAFADLDQNAQAEADMASTFIKAFEASGKGSDGLNTSAGIPRL